MARAIIAWVAAHQADLDGIDRGQFVADWFLPARSFAAHIYRHYKPSALADDALPADDGPRPRLRARGGQAPAP